MTLRYLLILLIVLVYPNSVRSQLQHGQRAKRREVFNLGEFVLNQIEFLNAHQSLEITNGGNVVEGEVQGAVTRGGRKSVGG